ncbi:hypothetical protein Lepto7376_3931 [[Leptolyngbya] sp. PCC 7376]|uniref:PepSY-associated TM helix domain-containing protein n=1 Tax=[Leptolyngbya] sp. PCC 7376 TaxID=111781 RepID=UPI00029F1161|nr:PepSY-associated TM helix domain-containing protein [[Leptolyngbya] sp. PCC 7376]AFY40080.1 hypothetical protein Lepto7376_3931 [[Leptolyngbya] sp. PCC 7376]
MFDPLSIKDNRKLHKWLSILIGIPIVFIIATGIFLQLRKPVDWIQPPLVDGSAKYDPSIQLEEVLSSVESVPAMKVNGWEDIKLFDIRPKQGTIKVRNHKELETQVDAKTGEVLQTRQRLNDIVSDWHEGNNRFTRLFIYLPIKIGFLLIFLTGVILNIKLSIKSFKKSKNKPEGKDKTSATKKPIKIRMRGFLLKYHSWLGWVVLVPWAFVISSGLLLQIRHEVPWVMPKLQTGQSTTPRVEIMELFEAAKKYPEYGVSEWKDVWRIYVYPNKGVSTVRAKNRNELQFDSETGELLHAQVRRADFLEDLHEGKLADIGLVDMNLWVFLPVNILSLILWLTGFLVLFR